MATRQQVVGWILVFAYFLAASYAIGYYRGFAAGIREHRAGNF